MVLSPNNPRIRGYRRSKTSTCEAQTQSTDSYILKNPDEPSSWCQTTSLDTQGREAHLFHDPKELWLEQEIYQRATRYSARQDKKWKSTDLEDVADLQYLS